MTRRTIRLHDLSIVAAHAQHLVEAETKWLVDGLRDPKANRKLGYDDKADIQFARKVTANIDRYAKRRDAAVSKVRATLDALDDADKRGLCRKRKYSDRCAGDSIAENLREIGIEPNWLPNPWD